MDSLKESHIVDLVLDGNPVKDRARDHATYVRYPNSYGSPFDGDSIGVAINTTSPLQMPSSSPALPLLQQHRRSVVDGG